MAYTQQDDGHDGAVRFTIRLTQDEIAELFLHGTPIAVTDGAVDGGHVEVVVRRADEQ